MRGFKQQCSFRSLSPHPTLSRWRGHKSTAIKVTSPIKPKTPETKKPRSHERGLIVYYGETNGLHHTAHASHTAHVTHAAATRHRRLFLGLFGNHRFGGDHQPGDR